MQIPRPPHCGSMHCVAGTSHSVPFQPLKHRQRPLEYCPLPLHSTGQAAAGGNRTTVTSALAVQAPEAQTALGRVGRRCPPSPVLVFPGSLLLLGLPGIDLGEHNVTRIPREQSGPRNPGKQWQVPETHSPFPWQFRGHSTTDSEEKRRDARCVACRPAQVGRCPFQLQGDPSATPSPARGGDSQARVTL